MDRSQLREHILNSKFFQHWHYFTFHFRFLRLGCEHLMVTSILDACLNVEEVIPGFAPAMIDSLADIGGIEKHEPHFEQLLQRLAELLVIRQIATWDWPQPVTIQWEPTAGTSKKNPEISISSEKWTIGVEVKAPSLLQHIRVRGSNFTQVSSRMFTTDQIKKFASADDGVTLPRDNPIKDFLISANAKFEQFRLVTPNFFGVLVIVWDDFIFEPISALTHKASGLFTENSFAKDAGGSPLTFPNVDSVIIVRHLHQLARATRDEPLIDGLFFALDYGEEGMFPFKCRIDNPHGRTPPEEIFACLQAVPPGPDLGAEYLPSDLVWWLNASNSTPAEPSEGTAVDKQI